MVCLPLRCKVGKICLKGFIVEVLFYLYFGGDAPDSYTGAMSEALVESPLQTGLPEGNRLTVFGKMLSVVQPVLL
jgi:hypothetical protein